MAGKTSLILGGGVGGIATANALREQLRPEHGVVVADCWKWGFSLSETPGRRING